MQQRRVRLGDILDDYCPRERRITNHAVVAMIDDAVKQTRCTTCDADHEYREGKLPAARRRKTGALVAGERQPGVAARPAPVRQDEAEPTEDLVASASEPEAVEPVEAPAAAAGPHEQREDEDVSGEADRDEWPVHRPLIRATLPRPEGQTPDRKAPDFTFRPPGGRFERNGQRRHRPMRHAHGQSSGQTRFGGQPRSGGAGQRQRQGAGPGPGQGQRNGNRQGPGGGSRSGRGRKRGR